MLSGKSVAAFSYTVLGRAEEREGSESWEGSEQAGKLEVTGAGVRAEVEG